MSTGPVGTRSAQKVRYHCNIYFRDINLINFFLILKSFATLQNEDVRYIMNLLISRGQY
jgi:hypothetical protein